MSIDRLPDLLDKNKHWQAVRIVPTRGMPHWEKLPETVEALDKFWAGELQPIETVPRLETA